MSKKRNECVIKCSTALALEIIGDRWSLLILRDYIFIGRREYNDFLELMEGISTNILASRLAWLTDAGIFVKHPHPTNKKKYYYEITEKGLDFIPIIMELAKWGWKHIPGAYSPPEIKKQYKENPDIFVKAWKKKVKECSKEYLKNATNP